MAYRKKINQRRVLAFNKANFQFPHEPSRCHPKIISHHHDALHMFAVALPQGLHKFGVFFILLGMQPLLELVKHDQHLLAGWNSLASTQSGERILKAQIFVPSQGNAC